MAWFHNSWFGANHARLANSTGVKNLENIALATRNYTLQFIAVHRWAEKHVLETLGTNAKCEYSTTKIHKRNLLEVGPGTSPNSIPFG
jgi:hypothetical protein